MQLSAAAVVITNLILSRETYRPAASMLFSTSSCLSCGRTLSAGGQLLRQLNELMSLVFENRFYCFHLHYFFFWGGRSFSRGIQSGKTSQSSLDCAMVAPWEKCIKFAKIGEVCAHYPASFEVAWNFVIITATFYGSWHCWYTYVSYTQCFDR